MRLGTHHKRTANQGVERSVTHGHDLGPYRQIEDVRYLPVAYKVGGESNHDASKPAEYAFQVLTSRTLTLARTTPIKPSALCCARYL